jgi:hypothetical protein
MPTWRHLRFPNLLLEGAVALSLAFLVWLYTRSRDQETLDNVPVPVEIGLAVGQLDQYDLEVAGQSRVPVSFTGPPSCIRELRGLLQRGAVQVDLTLTVPEERRGEARYHDTVRVQASDVPVPPGVVAMVAEGRNRIPVTLRRLVELRLPVRLDYVSDDRIGQLKLEPATVLVRGPQDVLERARAVPTTPYTLAAPPEPTSTREAWVRGQVPLVKELEGRPIRCVPAAVAFRIRFPPRRKVYDLANVPIKFLCPGDFALRPRFGCEHPGKLKLRVTGPADEPPAVQAYLDLTVGEFGPGRNVERLQIQLPRDYQLVKEPPRLIPFHLEPLDPPDGEPRGIR